ncbi:MAG: hypothetical protein MR769_08370 [Campylobacter sp.]|uniref:hypothetical protein n=1 Tax=Campylobacter sp. TaxID=205 RepID=UPI002AA909D2|nr:hypothetical protein [Campylobacter sp.]MCI6344676.1 hypothetical protein [Campylobacter sp.]
MVALLPRNDTGLGILDLCCPLNFAVAAVKTRLQDFRAIFSFKAASLAVGGGVNSCKNFALNFQGISRRKTVQKFLQSDWAAQGFKAKKRYQAAAQQKSWVRQI